MPALCEAELGPAGGAAVGTFVTDPVVHELALLVGHHPAPHATFRVTNVHQSVVPARRRNVAIVNVKIRDRGIECLFKPYA